MLVIISDLHLTDGSLGPTLPTAAMKLFAGRLNELARLRPIDTINLILLGDVLDLIRSAEWFSTDARPWHDPHSPAVFDTVSRITDRVLAENEAALRILRQAARGGVGVRIHFMVGDRDWPLHLPGEQYGRLRARVVESMGLANQSDLPFPHDPAEGGPHVEVLRQHRVLARHGDIYDPIHFDQDRNTSSLADALSIELFGRFHLEMRRFDGELPKTTFAALADLENVCPMLLAPTWIDDVLENTCNSAAMRSHIRSIWDRLVDQLLESMAIRSCEVWNPVDLVDGLAKTLMFRRGPRTSNRYLNGDGLAECFNGAGNSSEAFRRHALAEEAFRNRRVNHVVYGHGHAGWHAHSSTWTGECEPFARLAARPKLDRDAA